MEAKELKQFQTKLRKYIVKNFGKKCGHIGKDQMSLDCVACKSWLTYEFFSWFAETAKDLEND